VLIVASMLTGEFYPFSPFSMYSNPSTVPLRFCYVQDGEGEAIPILWHTGGSPASLSKKYRTHRGQWKEEIEDGERDPMEDMEMRAKSGEIVLDWLRDLSHKRPRRELTGPIQLVEIAVSADKDGLVETERVVARLPAEPGHVPEEKEDNP